MLKSQHTIRKKAMNIQLLILWLLTLEILVKYEDVNMLNTMVVNVFGNLIMSFDSVTI